MVTNIVIYDEEFRLTYAVPPSMLVADIFNLLGRSNAEQFTRKQRVSSCMVVIIEYAIGRIYVANIAIDAPITASANRRVSITFRVVPKTYRKQTLLAGYGTEYAGTMDANEVLYPHISFSVLTKLGIEDQILAD